MKSFFKNVFSSCLGVIVALIVISIFSVIIIGGIAKNAEKPKKVKANSILQIDFSKQLPEHTNNLDIDPFDFNNQKVPGLHAITEAISQAKTDKNIKGIYLDLNDFHSTRLATASVLFDALQDFKESGKFIIAYAKNFDQKNYYMASTADEIFYNPMGYFDFKGFGATLTFFKDMLDKIGVKMQIYYVGKFKSATEPFRMNEMSEENREQIREYLEPVYTGYLADIAKARGKTVAELREIANDFKIQTPEDAKTYGLVDRLGYKDEILALIREKLGLEEKDKINTVSIYSYATGHKKKPNYKIKEKIAVVFAEGSIITGEGKLGEIGDDKYTKIFRKLRKDDKIKAVVFRINSGGGSGLASENILREVNLTKEAGIPVIVSMGDYAASGGYYIACSADTILAEPNTLTGSIGVFGIIPNAYELYNEKLGIHFDTVKTTKFSTGLGAIFPLTDDEGQIIQNYIENFYENFLQRVADGRGMTRDEVHEIAQGRVWTGEKALELGLVDALGGLDDAIEIAANNAGLDEYRITEFPKVKEPIQKFIEELTGKDDAKASIIKSELGEYYKYYKYLQEVKKMEGVQARLPYLLEIE